MNNKGRFIIIIFLLIFTFLIASCTDDFNQESTSQDPELILTIKLPTTPKNDNNTQEDGLDYETEEQRQIQDIYVLEFDANDILINAVNPLEGELDKNPLLLKGKLKPHHDEVKLVVLANLRNQGEGMSDLTAESLMLKYQGKKKRDILKELIFTLPQENPWQLSEPNGRKLPMWGEIPPFVMDHQNIKSCVLFRAVAKMGVQIAPECDNFKLKEVYIYYANKQGYCAPVDMVPDPDIHIQFTAPEIPENTERYSTEQAVKYTLTEEEENGNALLNRIYVAESKNTALSKDEEPIRIVVGGLKGEDPDMQYFRIDMADDKATPGNDTPFDIIRNHSYLFTIRKVLGDGERTPDKALPKLIVDIEDYTYVFMRGVPDQYTLRTDKSLIRLKDNKDLGEYDLKVFTDLGEGWTIEKEEGSEWISIFPKHAMGGQECTLTIHAKEENQGTTREGSFYVVAGNIKKQIKVMMPQAETANSYVVGEGDHELVVTIKGNGKEGVFAEGGVSLIPGKAHPTPKEVEDFVNLHPAYVRVIWETSKNLVNLYDGDKLIPNEKIKSQGAKTSRVKIADNQNTVKYRVKINEHSNASIGGVRGGNALIGAFDENDNIIWSWHIWVAPDMIDEYGKVKDDCVERWTVNDYDVLDRNLGALSNRPIEKAGISSSVASMGLLYQWGRKDPFIGASYSNGFGANGKLPGNENGLLPVFHYYENWGIVEDDLKEGEIAINKTIQHPTLLINKNYTGDASNEDHNRRGLSFLEDIGQYLWGVADGLNPTTMNLGIKTIYDPSPVGFRVPPVDAFVFKALLDEPQLMLDMDSPIIDKKSPHGSVYLWPSSYGSSYTNSYINEYDFKIGYKYEKAEGWSSKTITGYLEPGETFTNTLKDQNITLYLFKTKISRLLYSSTNNNWRFNLIFVPHCVDGMKENRYQWGNAKGNGPFECSAEQAGSIYAGPYINDAPYYGFYLNYKKIDKGEPQLADITRIGNVYNTNESSKRKKYYYKLKPEEEASCTWFPLTAVYDPNKYQNGSVKLDQIEIQKGKSVTVNSFVWTNTTVTKTDKRILPAAMFLHGTEDQGKGHKPENGRHIHRLLDSGIEAEPNYAGAVRSIRDRKKTVWDVNSLTKSTTIKRAVGASTEITIVSVNSDWKLIKPGAPWIKATPDSGHADQGKGQPIKLTIIADKDHLPEVGTTTKLVFKIADGLFERTVDVKVVE